MDGRTLFRFGDWTVDPDREALIGPDGAEARLRRQSFAVLTHLARNAGRVVSKEELTAAIWPGVAVTDDSLVQCVHDIRAAIGPSGRQVVRTVPRRGYLLEAIPKEPPDAKPREAGAAADALAARPAPASRWRRAPWIVAGALVLALLAALTLGPGRSRQADGPPLVAVTPFQNLGDGTEAVYLPHGVRDMLVSELARSPFMKVLALEEATGATEAARDLGARYLLTGSVQRSAGAIRVVVQLIDAHTRAHIWAERIDRAGADPFAVQDAVAEEIVRSVAGERGLIQRAEYAEAWGKDSSSLGEYDYYLRGHALHMRFERDTNDQAQAVYEEGLSRYPDSSLLKIKLGYSHLARAALGWSADVEEDLKRARALGERGLAEAGESPLSLQTGHMLMADIAMLEGDFETAMRERAHVLELAPNDFFALANLGAVPIAAGRPQETIDAFEGVTPYYPAAEFAYGALAWAHFVLGDHHASIAAAEAALDPLPYLAFPFAAASHAELGNMEAAREEVRKLREAIPGASIEMMRAVHPTVDREAQERELAALRRAGLPERAPAAPEG